MKRRCQQVFGCVIAVCIILGILNYISDLLERKYSNIKYAPFFEQQGDFDVLFMGTSHVINGVFPMELWNDYGIISYNFGGHSNQLPITYWVQENALNYTTPRLVVIDCYLLSSNIKTYTSFNNIHSSLDAFPLSLTKVLAVRDLLNDKEMEELIATGDVADTEVRTMGGLLWEYSVYHSRWDSLGQSDFIWSGTSEKGAEARPGVAIQNEMAVIAPDEKLDEETKGTEYLRRMIENCQNRGIEILLIYLPFHAEEQYQKEANRLCDIAEEYEVNYINFLDMSVVDNNTDFCDNQHLNPSGARKVSDYLGQYIIEHYCVPDQRNNEEYSSWFQDYKEYTNFKLEEIKEQTSLDTYLMLLVDKNYNMIFEIKDSSIWQNKYYVNLFENLGIDSKKVTDRTDFIVVQGAGENVDYFVNFYNSPELADTDIGNFYLTINEDGNYVVYLEDQVFYSLSAEQNKGIDVRIILFDKDTMEIVDNVGFSFDSKADMADDTIVITEIRK